MSKLYPRMLQPEAEAKWDELKPLLEAGDAPEAFTNLSDAYFTATGAGRVCEADLIDLRTGVVRLAKECGFSDADLGRRARADFDAKCATFLVENMDISPSEASRNSVWSFITLNVLADVAAWRFRGLHRERFLGGRTRNTFQRLWWRAHLISREDPRKREVLLNALPEDALVQITERPGVCADGRLATAIAEVGLDEVSAVEAGAKEQVFRSALKRIRQVLPVICSDALTEDQLRYLVREQFRKASESV